MIWTAVLTGSSFLDFSLSYHIPEIGREEIFDPDYYSSFWSIYILIHPGIKPWSLEKRFALHELKRSPLVRSHLAVTSMLWQTIASRLLSVFIRRSFGIL
ncbi:hypothetical protein RRG08_036712 [Elysia crispata]|uniref:Uncharacterized protein n=1 Tax=Elysia crispata TaxID=231223 RepID=A0AAE0XUC0_9GAST|nr:hypothetical protein RRG08_036712 [Elysia crispata]